ncbi:MAG: 4Fe-4S binding protein [Atopobiaceae bacterium]|jgi:NAD-dependent dihydropyrimidine dehydrogenase PreA subunit|uniref:4Fe-4S dicluster domain-containing protein n=1 Tax=Muricaecibacterium torontonense TaxID=3032871 RepID=A0A4S2F4H8_9ACTN|nr:4Fe-4S binding protein [Muricaecibacterium torontonense]MCI8676590.1 4Fe-4S binding protein [Atopobiaceae bacterium]TGY62513.1 4Fe-4S dicluster domain-containing protein [Muricaecibacterium torontonense]
MAEKRDFLDDIIDMSQDFKAIKNPLAQIANSLAAEPGEVPVWNPADYKERPRPAPPSCTSCKSKDPTTCTRCIDVCPKGSIHIEGGGIEIDDTCIKCGLCVSACPSESYHAREINANKLYDRIAGAAASHETAYVTCTRALGRLPRENEVVLPCIGVVPSEVWLALMVRFSHLSIYLPLGICDRCRTTTGEEVYCDLIARAETWAGFGLNLVVDEEELTCEMRRSWQRKEFVETILKSGERLVSRTNPVLTAARRVTQMLDAHKRQMSALQRQLDKAVGTTSSKNRRRILLDRRKIMMGALQKHPELAANIDLYEPLCDMDACTLCGACEQVCPTHCIEITDDGRWSCEPEFCVQCGACEHVCPTKAIEYEFCDASDIVLPDEEERDRKEKEAEQKAEVEKLKEQGKASMLKGLDMLEKLSDSLADNDS